MAYPTIIPLKARMSGHVVQIWWDTKWRSVSYYNFLTRLPSPKIYHRYITTFKLAAGIPADQKCEIKSFTREV